MIKNKLYFGDNLDILLQLYKENPKGFIDLIYIDPPFNSKRNYNVLFESADLLDATAQKEAFADTWSNVSYMDTLNLLSDLNINLYNFLKNLENIGISISAISYLTTMAIRLYYIQKLLKETGTFYLHCDPTMSHYLKIICDLVFYERNFKNEIVWCYRGGGVPRNDFANKHDIIFRYTKSDKYTFNLDDVRIPYSEDVLKSKESRYDKSYRSNKVYEGYRPNVKGKHPEDWWTIQPLMPSDKKERLSYPTQKPEKLLEIIIKASSNKNDLVADFFCGCGTTIAVAEKLDRQWLGVDISHLAIRLISNRIGKEKMNKTYEIHGFPQDIGSAKELAENVKGGRLEFEEWVIEYLLHGILNEKRNEMGFDGYRTFSTFENEKQVVMIEVKSGNATITQLSHFIKVVDDKKGSIGVFVCWNDQITKNMELMAKKAGYYDLNNAPYCDKIQIVSVEDLLEGKLPKIPESKRETFKKTIKKSKPEASDQQLKF